VTDHPGLTGNEGRARWYALVHDRAQRRQEFAAAADREAGDRAANPIAKVKDGYNAARRAERAFDAAEPPLSFEEFCEREAAS
jgi:hypothetical protein